MIGNARRLVVAVTCGALLAGCASAGRVELDDGTYRLNRSAIEHEDKQFRLWVWRYRAGPFKYFGESPLGFQLLIPDDVEEGARLTVGENCSVWTRDDWNLVGAVAGTLWVPALSGYLLIDHWAPDFPNVTGRFEIATAHGPLSGTFVVSDRTLSNNVIR